jgi:hypothetical protein
MPRVEPDLPFEQRLDFDHVLEIQAQASQDFYTIDEATIASLHEIVKSNKGICSFQCARSAAVVRSSTSGRTRLSGLRRHELLRALLCLGDQTADVAD